MRPYEELVQFIASLSPRDVIDLNLLRQRASASGKLDHYLEIEHLMRRAKARARQLLAHGR